MFFRFENLPDRQCPVVSSSETEFGEMLRAIAEFDNEHPASSFPRLLGFPDVTVLVIGRVITQTAVARADRFFDHNTWLASDLLKGWSSIR